MTTTVHLTSHHGTMLTAEVDGSINATRTYETPGPWETWTCEYINDEQLAFRSHHGGYLRAEGGGGMTIAADAHYESPGPWEIFGLERQPEGGYALRCHDGIHVVTAELDGRIVVDRTEVGPWEQWQIVPDPFAVDAGGGVPVVGNRIPAGVVRLVSGRVCQDDNGSFLALGCSFFYVSRAWRDFRTDRYEPNQTWLARHGWNYYRGFASVGGWPDPDGWANARTYPEWALEMLPQWLDDSFTRFGLRCDLTLFDGEVQYRTDAEQDAFVHGVCDVILPRMHTIMAVQVANEYNPCGWDYPEGIERLRRHCRTLRSRLGPGPMIALSSRTTAMSGGHEEDFYSECHRLFDGLLPDIVTVSVNHDSREVNTIDEHWRHVRQGWERVIHDPYTHQPIEPDASIDDEPMGPCSSVAAEESPSLIVSKAICDYISGRHAYTFHPDAGIWSDLLNPPQRGMGYHKLIQDHPPSPQVGEAFARLMPLLPPDMPVWDRLSHHIAGHPFAQSFEQQGDHFTQIWPDQITAHGVVRAFGALGGTRFIVGLMGVRDYIDLKWQHPMRFDIYRCGDGTLVQQIDDAQGGGTLRIGDGVDTDLVVIGQYI